MKTVTVDVERPIALVTLNRPDRLNALNEEVISELSGTLDELEKMDDVRAIIITGAGKAFCAGADVSTFKGMAPVRMAIFSREVQALMSKIEWYTKPVLAAINGYALGGGLELAMACDLRIASESANLGQPEINLGTIPGAGGTQRLPRIAGRSRAKLLIYTGDRVSASEALSMGLVDRVVPPESLLQEVKSLALKIAEKPPLALMAAKYAIQMGLESNMWSGLAGEAWLFGLMASTGDFAEGISAFLERRRASFKGS